MKKSGISLFVCGLVINSLCGQEGSLVVKNDSIEFSDYSYLVVYDSIICNQYEPLYSFILEDSTLILEDSPIDSVYEARLNQLNQLTPIDLDYNKTVQSFIDLYLVKKRELTATIIGKSALYFPVFESLLDRHNLPQELKYLPIIESALISHARSRAGAKGLWQFMYSTGIIYGLKVSSYVDDRCDPLLSTEAACRYLKFLHKLYGDWGLALSAYNAGPGNVNKAIRRSGGKTNFWEIRNFLPKETRGYYPAFIAVNYVMNNYFKHGIEPAKYPHKYYETDTIHVNKTLSFGDLELFLNVKKGVLKELNPRYRHEIVSVSTNPMPVRLPIKTTGVFLANEDSIYHYIEKKQQKLKQNNAHAFSSASARQYVEYHVRKGDVIGKIARRYGCSVSQIRNWNNLRSNTIRIGQRLMVYTNSSLQQLSHKKKESGRVQNTNEKAKVYYYIVKRGDTLWSISKKYEGVNVNDIRKTNKNINIERLKPGQKLKIVVQS